MFTFILYGCQGTVKFVTKMSNAFLQIVSRFIMYKYSVLCPQPTAKQHQYLAINLKINC